MERPIHALVSIPVLTTPIPQSAITGGQLKQVLSASLGESPDMNIRSLARSVVSENFRNSEVGQFFGVKGIHQVSYRDPNRSGEFDGSLLISCQEDPSKVQLLPP